jgi:FtsP/CotA-like multicopper oxidase with cupredoxin domain
MITSAGHYNRLLRPSECFVIEAAWSVRAKRDIDDPDANFFFIIEARADSPGAKAPHCHYEKHRERG